MRPHATPTVARPTRPGATNGATRDGWALPPAPLARRPRRRRIWWRALEGLAAAALVLAMAAGLATGWGLLPGQDGEEGTTVPAAANATSGPAVVDGAAMFLGNAARTGEVAGPGPTDEPELRWRTPLAAGQNGHFYGQPVVVDGVVYLAGRLFPNETEEGPGSGAVLAVDLATGRERWRASVVVAGAAGEFVDVGQPAVADGLVYVGTVVATPVAEIPQTDPATGEETGVVVQSEPAAALVALDARSGAERWRASTGKDNLPSPAAIDGVVYVPAQGALLALDGATGAERWRFAPAPADPAAPDGPWFGPPAVADGTVFTTDGDGVLHALDVRSGTERWRVGVPGGERGDPVVAGGTVYVGSTSYDGPAPEDIVARLLALDATTGDPRWTYEADSPIRTPTVGAGSVYLTAEHQDETSVVALDLGTGNERWRTTVDGYSADPPLLAAAVLYVETFQDGWLDLTDFGGLFGLGDRNYLHALDAASGRKTWQVQIDPFASAPAVADGAVYLTTPGDDGDDGTLHAYADRPISVSPEPD